MEALVRMAVKKYSNKERWAGHRLLRLLRKVTPNKYYLSTSVLVAVQHIVKFAFDKRNVGFWHEIETDDCREVFKRYE